MAKGSGSTRITSPSYSKITGGNQHALIDAIAKGDIPSFDSWVSLSSQQQKSILAKANFNGATSDDLSDGTVYIEDTKDHIVALFQDTLVNLMQGHGIQDEFYTVLYKDGSKRYLDESTNDFEHAKITDNMGKQAYTNAKNVIQLSKVAAIIRSDADGQPHYYLAKGGEQQMHNYGFDFWKNGKQIK